MRDLIKTNNRGSYTVEAAIVFSVIIIVLSCLVLSFMLMYHKVLLTKTAGSAAQKAAAMWTQGDNLYDGIFGDQWGEKKYSETVQGAVDLEIRRAQLQSELDSGLLGREEIKYKAGQLAVYRELSRIVRKPESTTVNFNYKRHLLAGEIIVTITQEMKIPFGSLKYYFDGKDTLTLIGTGTAAVVQPAEYVRNVDLVLEYAGKLKAREGIKKIQNWIVK